MGISTVASYTRRPGLRGGRPRRRTLVDEYFTGTAVPARRRRPRRHRRRGRRPARAWPTRRTASALPHRRLDVGGEYQWRREGEPHLFDPETVFRLQHSTRTRRYDIFKQYTARVDEQSERLMTLRGLFALQDRACAPPVPLDEVEPVSEIVKRFSTGAMCYGSISPGGARDPRDRDEPARRQVQHRRGRRGRRPAATTPSAARAIKQVASGRFGVTSDVPDQRRRHPDQDGAGRQARRGRPAARPQGLPVGRQDPALHARRRPDLARRRTTTSTRSRTSPS